jgi:hypothetical protein
VATSRDVEVPDGVHALVHAVQAAREDPATDLLVRQVQIAELIAGDPASLPGRHLRHTSRDD